MLEGLPALFTKAFPYKERPRSNNLYGVTEVLYCPRKTFLSRFVPAPTAVEFETRRRFARGHAMEDVFFGDDHNPTHIVGSGALEGLEGHTDHSINDDDGKVKTIVEFKSVKKLWHKAPNGKVYFSAKAAKNVLPKSDWSKIERNFNDSHMDQLMMYMMVTDALDGYLIYYEMSTDDNFTWSITKSDITDEFKDRMIKRLDYIKLCCSLGAMPERRFGYPWECMLCNFNKNGICGLCDKEGFDFPKMCQELKESRDLTNDFGLIVGKYMKEFNVEAGTQTADPEYKDEIDNGSSKSVA